MTTTTSTTTSSPGFSINNTGDPSALTSESNAASSSLEFRVLKFCIYVLIFAFSVGGNTLTFLSVVIFQRMKSVPNIFIASLAICDLVTTITSIPFDLIEEEMQYFPFGRVTCRFLYPLATISTTSACFTLVAISLDRYRAIIHPLDFKYRLSRRGCLYTIGLIHFLSALAVVPYFIHLHYNRETRRCEEAWPQILHRKTYTIFLFLIQYGIPLLIMSVVYLRLGAVLFKSDKEANRLCSKNISSSQRNGLHQSMIRAKVDGGNDRNTDSLRRRKTQNKKTVKMFLFIVIIFLIFMQPNQLFWLWMDHGSPGDFDFALIAFICRAFTYTNSVLNAVIYGVCNKSFREAFSAIVKCRCGARYERERKRTATSVFHSSPSIRDRSRTTSKLEELNGNRKAVPQLNGNFRTKANGLYIDKCNGSVEVADNFDSKRSRKVSFGKETNTTGNAKDGKNVNEIENIFSDTRLNNTAQRPVAGPQNVDCELPLVETEMLLERLFLEIELERILDLHPEVNLKLHGVQDCFESLDETSL